MFRAVISGLVDFLFPKPGEIYQLESLSPSELMKNLTQAEDLGQDTVAIWNYTDEMVRNLIWELKYRKNPKIIETLSIIVFDVLKSEFAERALLENFLSPLLVPIPMSGKKRRERGWNQTEILCENIVKLDSEKIFEYAPNALQKIHHTESQTLTKNKKERRENIEGSMQANGDLVSGRNIVLLDDVTTTGATFRDARRALKSAGAKKILCLALAH